MDWVGEVVCIAVVCMWMCVSVGGRGLCRSSPFRNTLVMLHIILLRNKPSNPVETEFNHRPGGLDCILNMSQNTTVAHGPRWLVSCWIV